MKKGGEKMKGVIMAALLSFGCSEVAFNKERMKRLRNFVLSPTKENEVQARKTLESLPILFPYLELIARFNFLDPFDEKVVEGYFIGNELINKVSPMATFKATETILKRKKLSEKKIKKILLDLEEKMIPYHNFYVLAILPRIEKISHLLSLLDLCRVIPAEVVARKKEGIEVKYYPLIAKGEKLEIGKISKKTMALPLIAKADFKKGDIVALHWNNVCIRLDDDQKEALQKYTQYSLQYAIIKGE